MTNRTSSVFKFSTPYPYSEIATPQTEEIISHFLNVPNARNHPLAVHLGGIPGAGKTTFYTQQQWPEHVLIAFDDIMERMEGYQSTLEKDGSEAAFKACEAPARVIGLELLERAVVTRSCLFFDHGASSSENHHMLKILKETFGYTVHMHYILCDLQRALGRVEKRQKTNKRFFPADRVVTRQQLIADNMPTYRAIAEKVCLWDNNGESFTLISG